MPGLSTFTTLELFKEDMKFSAAHFTIFSASERENLHGHNFRVHLALELAVQEDGMGMDYRIYKRRIRDLCQDWDEITLLPTRSPHLRLEQDDSYIYAHFAGEKLPFLKRDVLLLPIINATVEELARLMLERFIGSLQAVECSALRQATLKIYSGPGQSGSCTWQPETAA
jgi:6-pyruvoyltetrahydropterin/6-carboxytetrahydropterin synthase